MGGISVGGGAMRGGKGETTDRVAGNLENSGGGFGKKVGSENADLFWPISAGVGGGWDNGGGGQQELSSRVEVRRKIIKGKSSGKRTRRRMRSHLKGFRGRRTGKGEVVSFEISYGEGTRRGGSHRCKLKITKKEGGRGGREIRTCGAIEQLS